jgi:hypothetical protein
LFAYFFNKYSTINFKISAINEFYYAKTEGSDLPLEKGDKLLVSLFNKIRIMTGFFPNKRLRRFIEKGERKLKKEFDHIKIIKDIKKLQQVTHKKPLK